MTDNIYLKTAREVAADAISQSYRLESGKIIPLTWGIPEIDDVVNTCWAGRLMTIVGRPGHYKTGVSIHLARREIQRIIESGLENHVVLFLTLEESETDVLMALASTERIMQDIVLGRASAASVREDIYQIGDFPVLLVGYRPAEVATYRYSKGLPVLTYEQIAEELLEYTRSTGVKISAIFVDYLQVLTTSDSDQESFNLVVGEMMRKLRVMGQSYECPVVVNVQAKESVDAMVPPIPRGNHAFYSSQILHTSDIMVSVVLPGRYPKSSWGNKDVLVANGKSYQIADNTVLINLIKQRRARGYGTWIVEADLGRNFLREATPIQTVRFGDDDD